MVVSIVRNKSTHGLHSRIVRLGLLSKNGPSTEEPVSGPKNLSVASLDTTHASKEENKKLNESQSTHIAHMKPNITVYV